MTEKELRNLSRRDLLEMLVAQTKELNRVKGELEEARAALEDRRILMRESGSIAEAALKLNHVFEAAQAAADQYLRSIRQEDGGGEEIFLSATSEAEAQERLEQTRLDCELMRVETEKECSAMREAARRECEELLEQAQSAQRRSQFDELLKELHMEL